jgi:hypothetical protein
MANRTRSKKRSKSKKMYRQRGGALTEEQENTLLQDGFTQQQVNFFNENNILFQNIQQANQFVLNNNQNTIAMFIASCLQNEDNQNPQNEMQQDLHIDDLQVDNQNGDLNIDDLQGEEGEGEGDLNAAFIQDDNNNELNNSGETDPEQGSFSFDEDEEEPGELGWNDQPNNQAAGKRRKTRKTRKGKKSKKSRKSRKQRGGMRYGTGVGSNCFEPNYSIYNTPALSLFPYKPN